MSSYFLVKYFLFVFLLQMLITGGDLKAQQQRLITVDSLFSMAERNSKQIDMARQHIGISEQGTSIAKSARLPELGAAANLGYLSNAEVWDNHLQNAGAVIMPHVSNSFSLDASLTVFKGKSIANGIEKAKLGEQLSYLDYQKNKEDIQLLLFSKYLDLFTLSNQEKVYAQNIDLANKRLSDIQKLNREGMITNNDVIRSKLQITDLQLKQKEIINNIAIINKDISVVIGLPEGTEIQVDTALYKLVWQDVPLPDYLENRESRIPELEAADVQEKIASREVALTKADKFPAISLYAGDETQRPFLYSIPPQDIYMHLFQAGIRLRYNISSLYQSGQHIRKAEQERHLAQTQKEWLMQQSEIEIHQAYVKFNEAKDTYHMLEESFLLGQDNYRVMEKKYLNQLAVMTDILDASTALLSSQLNLSNARIAIVYRWYNLKKVSGNFDYISKTDLKK